jgi:flagellar motor switch protein FliG
MGMTLTGPQRAAVVFAQLDDTRAQMLLRALSENEVVRLLAEVAQLPAVGPDDVKTVMSDFATQAVAFRQVRQGGIEVARRWLEQRLGQSRAAEILSGLESVATTQPLDYLNFIEAGQIAGFLQDEHPQVTAVVLANIDSEHAARVVDRFNQDLASDVVRRIATMGPVPPMVVQQMAESMESRLSNLRHSGMAESGVGGVATAAAVLNNVDRASEQEVLTRIEASDPALAEHIRNEMFVFDDVVQLDEMTLQVVLRNINVRELALAIKTVVPEVRDRFVRNMSERTAADLEEELGSLGPQRLSAIEAAQTAVVKAARELADNGEITLGRANDEIVM